MLDWELSTLGDPLADFTYLPDELGHAGDDGRSGLGGPGPEGAGHPDASTRPSALYCRLTGRDGVPELDWYFAYNLFRLAGICPGHRRPRPRRHRGQRRTPWPWRR